MQIKYYMNNPCFVIREITDEFSEVKVNPKYAENMEGSQWCTECMVGNQGTPQSHTCEEYQEVIDAINDEESAMIIVVENRLLADEPVEFKAIRKLRHQIESGHAKEKELRKIHSGLVIGNREQSEKIKTLSKSIERLDKTHSVKAKRLFELTREVECLKDKRNEMDDQVSIGGITISMSAGELKELIRTSVKMRHLEIGGVDDWEWYGESLPDSDEIDSEVEAEISNMQIKDIG